VNQLQLHSFALVFNITSLVLVLGVALAIAQTYKQPYFKAWLLSGAFGLAGYCAEALRLVLGRTWAILVILCLAIATIAWFTAQIGRYLEGRPLPGRLLAGLIGATLAWAVVALAAGIQDEFVVLPPVVLLVSSEAWLGVMLLAHNRRRGLRSGSWVAWLPIVMAAWIVVFPFLVDTTLYPAAQMGSGMLGLVFGMGMVLFLLEDSADALRAKNQELERLTAAKSEFLRLVSHEFRTPLTVVKGFTSALQDRLSGPLTTRQEDDLVSIEEATTRLDSMIDALLAMARLEAGKLPVTVETINLAEAIGDIGALMRQMAEREGLKLDVEEMDSTVEVLADPDHLDTVLANLVGNACKFTPRGGAVHLAFEVQGPDVWVCVRDTGVGISPESLSKVFDPFFQADASLTREHGGTGLGLAIVKGLVEAMGGKVRAESLPGQGSAFSFSLPLA
jgi:signal transduction histidine kinase